jgi:hypothetical protein
VSPLRTRPREPDQACAEAEDLARDAAAKIAGPGRVGDHLAAEPEADRVVTHMFSCLDPAYRDWRWAVTVARASRSKTVTVSESVLLPGPDAVLAPPWVPWRERLRPGDLGVGDILPAPADDERLAPVAVLEGEDGLPDWQEASWTAADVTAPGPVRPVNFGQAGAAEAAGAGPGTEAPAREEPVVGQEPAAGQASAAGQEPVVGQEPAAGPESPAEPAPPAGAGKPGAALSGPGRQGRRRAGGAPETVPRRSRVLSAIGRDEAAFRWYASEHGPDSPLARAAPGPCSSCGFFIRLAGPLGRVFGACGNEFAPDDGRVVSADHGCGAHSEALLPPGIEPPVSPVIDELGYDLVDVPGVSVEETVFEPIEHG